MNRGQLPTKQLSRVYKRKEREYPIYTSYCCVQIPFAKYRGQVILSYILLLLFTSAQTIQGVITYQHASMLDIPYSRKILRGIKFGGLAVYMYIATAKLKSAKISYSHIYVWRSCTEPPKLNPPIFLQQRFWAQPPNLIPANISGYTVHIILCTCTHNNIITRRYLRSCTDVAVPCMHTFDLPLPFSVKIVLCIMKYIH